MNKDKLRAVTLGLTKLSMLHTHQLKLNDSLFMIWYEILDEYTVNQIETGFKDVCKTCKSFPTPAHVVEAIQSLSIGNSPTPDQAWIEADKKCSSLSWGDHAPVYSHQFIADTVKVIGGCMRFSECNEFNYSFFKKRFYSVYKDICAGKHVDTLGIIDALELGTEHQQVVQYEGI